MSQYTFKGFPLLPGSIQYSPPPLEEPKSRMSLQDWAGLLEYQPRVSEVKEKNNDQIK